MDKIKAAGNLYQCRDCPRQFERIEDAENHKRAKGGGTPLKHDYEVVSRD